jgi:hypothetical protein
MFEKRKLSRVLFSTKAKIRNSSYEYKGQVLDLSLNSAFIKTTSLKMLQEKDSIKVKLLMSGVSTNSYIEIEGEIQRLDEEGIAVKFNSMDIDSFIYLKNIVAYNNGNHQKIVSEFLEL